MDFKNLVEIALSENHQHRKISNKSKVNEEAVAGGAGSVFGPNVGSTSTAFSGDTYASGDARNVHGLYGGIITRSGNRKKKSKKYKRNKK